MKILMIVPEPFFSPRGTPFSVYYRTQALCALGHRVDILTYPMGRDVDIPGARVERIPTLPFIKQVKVGPSLAKLPLDLALFCKAFWKLLTHRYDALHAHEEAVFFCLAYKLFFRKPRLIYDMHSSLPQQLKNFAFSNNRLLASLFDWLERRAIHAADAVITICPELQKKVEALGAGTPSILIENTLFDPIAYLDSGDEISDDLINWERFNGKKLVLYTGTFEPYQGIPLLLESAREVLRSRQDVLFVLIGGRPDQLIPMRTLARRLGMSGHVLFTGSLHPNTVKRFIRRADVLVSPRTRGSNTPLKIYEYLASGKPIVATDLETHNQVLTSSEAVLTACEPKAFASGISRALDQSGEGNPVGRQGKALYESSYGEGVYVSRLKKVMLCLGARQ